MEQFFDLQINAIFIWTVKQKTMPKFKDYKQGQQQALFPLDIASLISDNHLVRQIDKVVDRISIQKLQVPFSDQGASSYHPQMMLKVIIYAYCTKNYSCRSIAAMLRQDITYMWLSGMQAPDFNTVNRFRSKYLKDILEKVFTEVLLFLKEHDFIKFENYFVDGTKLEADAGKYSHIWKKNTERYKARVQQRVKTLMNEIEKLNNREDKIYKGKDLPELGEQSKISSKHVEDLAQAITNKLVEKQDDLKKKDIKAIKSKINKLNKEKENLLKYEGQEGILGERNSCSKTDNDATMMRMKGTEELRPGYNIQVSSENQFVTNLSVGQSASDSVCFKDHLEKIIKRGDDFLPKNYVGDSGYGSEENYEALEKGGINNFLKYASFHKEQGKKHKENIFHKDNLPYNEQEDCFVCPNNVKLLFKEEVVSKTENGFKQTLRLYEAQNCCDCSFKGKCTKAKGNRIIQVNKNLEKYKAIARKNLNSETGKELRKRRGWEIETFFGDLKYNQKYKRFRLRGLEKVFIELVWLSISYNIRKMSRGPAKMAA